MGAHKNISATTFPRQGGFYGRRVKVIFHQGGPSITGLVIRDDVEDPWRTIIQLDSGQVVLATECMYSQL